MDSLGKRIREYRVRHGLTQGGMAKLCGLTRATICTLESDRYSRPNFKTLHKVFNVLNQENQEEEKEND